MKRKTLSGATRALPLVVAFLVGCANLQTVGRTTSIPPIEAKGDGEPDGIAIHLDAQQRLVLATARGYCAEPSPDALSAYAASLGLGIATPSREQISAAQGLQSATGSIGLRTQSITLMRDALYRMCEASINGDLANWEIASFLRRSQDLTAVVLAIEQLTGAVSASQVVLVPTANSDVSASLLSNEQLLDQAEQRVAKLQEHADDKQAQVQQIEMDLAEVKNKQQEADGEEKELETDEIDALEQKLEAAKNESRYADERLKDAVEVRDAIKDSRDAALTNASLQLGGVSESLRTVRTHSLDAASASAIASSVAKMVVKVLEKDYSKEYCFSYLTVVGDNVTAAERINNLTLFCREALRNGAASEEDPDTVTGEADGDPKGTHERSSTEQQDDLRRELVPPSPET